MRLCVQLSNAKQFFLLAVFNKWNLWIPLRNIRLLYYFVKISLHTFRVSHLHNDNQMLTNEWWRLTSATVTLSTECRICERKRSSNVRLERVREIHTTLSRFNSLFHDIVCKVTRKYSHAQRTKGGFKTNQPNQLIQSICLNIYPQSPPFIIYFIIIARQKNISIYHLASWRNSELHVTCFIL